MSKYECPNCGNKELDVMGDPPGWPKADFISRCTCGFSLGLTKGSEHDILQLIEAIKKGLEKPRCDECHYGNPQFDYEFFGAPQFGGGFVRCTLHSTTFDADFYCKSFEKREGV